MAHTIVTIVGSLRKESFSLKIANTLAKLAPASLKLDVTTLGGISFFNQDLEANPPADWLAFRDKLQKSNGVLFVTPEYNRSIPGVLKNAIDVASRPYGKSSFLGKPVGIVGNSPGALGAVTDQHGPPRRSPALERRDRVDQASDAVPGAEGSGEHRDQIAGLARERHRSDRAGMEAHRVRAPLRLENSRGRRVRRQDRAIGRDDQIGGAALPFAPAPHRFGDEQAIHGALGRARIVDDGRVDLEHGAGADGAGGEQALAAEVVVALDDDVRPQRRGQRAQASSPQQPQVRRSKRRPDIVPRGRKCRRRRE